jgi:putative DNA methylase
MEYPKKLIEVTLPLDDINAASIREKSISFGHPSSFHLWWARRPLATARAILFAQLVNDPGGKRGYGAYKGQTKEDAQKERERLFQIIRDLVKWENTNNEEVLERAREEIRKSWQETCKISGDNQEKMPPFLDPFAGGGTIPLEAQRLGLESHASDLNPVAVMINKAMIEIPPKFAGRKPVGPLRSEPRQENLQGDGDWRGTRGLAEDVRRYGEWMREEAWRQIGHLYPQVNLPNEYGGGKATVIAWIWVRTVKSPNPVWSNFHVPLASSFVLSSKRGMAAWVEAIIDSSANKINFVVRTGEKTPVEAKRGTRASQKATFTCVYSGVPITANYIRKEGKEKRIKHKLIAIVAEGNRRRIYLSSSMQDEEVAAKAKPNWVPSDRLPDSPRYIAPPLYGMPIYSDLFTQRQLVALTTFSDLVSEVIEKIKQDAKSAGWEDDGKGLNEKGIGATAYGEAIGVYLALAVDRLANRCSSACFWDPGGQKVQQVFARQAIPMTWDFTEANPFSSSSGNFIGQLKYLCKVITQSCNNKTLGKAWQADATKSTFAESSLIISTDPPYYDNIGYADLSDFFYVWMRRTLKNIFPDIFSTMLVPKEQELVATPYRHETKEKAEAFFMKGMTSALNKLRFSCHPALPVSIYYAFKQSETKNAGIVSPGWESFLQAVIGSGFVVTGTWPVRTELIGNLKKKVNALASSIVLVCRKRPLEAPTISRKQFLRELDEFLPEAIEDMIGGKEGASPIAPVDLAQATIGPGMAVFSKYGAVLEADGSPMSVHTALILINKAIDEYFTHAESSMGSDTRFCVDWFQHYGLKAGPFGEADVLARAKAISVEGLAIAGVVESGGGKVRLLSISEYPDDWDPERDKRVPIWEACHHMCRALQESEMAAGELLAQMPEKAEPIRQLAYRLYTLCERKGWAQEALLYNGLITSWRAILEASHEIGHRDEQLSFDV